MPPARRAGTPPHGRGPPPVRGRPWERDELAARFFEALQDGDIEGLRELLAADVQMVGDGGGQAPAFARGVNGADNVARVLASNFPRLFRIGVAMQPHEVNGQPGAIFRDRDNRVISIMTLDAADGQVHYAVINPDKLGHLGPVADAWAVSREANQARGPPIDPNSRWRR